MPARSLNIEQPRRVESFDASLMPHDARNLQEPGRGHHRRPRLGQKDLRHRQRANLLSLLADHVHKAKIDLAEAKRVLQS